MKSQFTNGGALPYISWFHSLRLLRQLGRLTAEDEQMLELLQDLFEPRRITHRGLVRIPVRLPARRRVLIQSIAAETISLGLRRIEFRAHRVLPACQQTHLSIRSATGETWYAFSVRNLHLHRDRQIATADLEAFLGTRTVHPGTLLAA